MHGGHLGKWPKKTFFLEVSPDQLEGWLFL
jgi:hypothetical protein